MRNNNLLIWLIYVVFVIFAILISTIDYDSEEDLVGEIKEVELFMIEIAEVKFFDGEYDICIVVSSPIEFQDLNMIFDYVRMICYYGDYLIFESQGVMYITNAIPKALVSDIDDRAGLGGVL